MTSFELLKLLGNAQDEYIMDSRKRPKPPKKPPILKIAAMAACAAILIGLGGTALYLRPWSSGSSAPTNPPETLSSPVPMPSSEISSTGEDIPETSANPLESDGITLLSAAQTPAMPKTDEERSKAWQENQVSEDTDYALSAFAYQLGSKVLANTEDSVCFSPVSLYQVLSVITSGAEGSTQEQLLSLLGQGDVDTLKTQMQKLYQVNQQDTETDHLEFAGSLWLDEKQQDGENQVGFHQDWVMQAAMDYYCDVYAADFSSGAANAPLAAWINQHTGNLMADRHFTMSEDTVMAAVNTVYYHSQWAEQFTDTVQDTFTAQDGTQSTCDFMQRTEMSGEAVVTDRYTKSYLPLSTGQMYVVLPKDGVDLDDLLSEDTLWEMFEDSSYESAQVEWSVPKFTTDTDLDLKDALTAAGVTDAFDSDAANFSDIADTSLYLSSVIQGTHIAVNEDGIEAASYSLAGMEAGGAAPEEEPVVEMTLDRPFLYLVTALDGSPLFFGVVRNIE